MFMCERCKRGVCKECIDEHREMFKGVKRR